jgi:hypothetical protein
MTEEKPEVVDYLAHYASEFYDPNKAHEYYVRNRELKGRAPVKGETKTQRTARVATARNQREAKTYVDKMIGTKKSGESKSLQKSQQARMEQLRKNADASRKRIDDKLKKFLESLKTAKATPLNEIPANASPDLRAYLEKQNESISKSNALVKDKAATEAKKAASSEMKRVGTELKAAVANARTSYAKAKADMETKYKNVSDTEHKNIAANVK